MSLKLCCVRGKPCCPGRVRWKGEEARGDARGHTQTGWGHQGRPFAQICQQVLRPSGMLLLGDQGTGNAGGVSDLDGMREAEASGIHVGEGRAE